MEHDCESLACHRRFEGRTFGFRRSHRGGAAVLTVALMLGGGCSHFVPEYWPPVSEKHLEEERREQQPNSNTNDSDRLEDKIMNPSAASESQAHGG